MAAVNTIKYYSNKAIGMYFALLLLSPMLFGYPMEWFGYVWGIVSVVLFFYGSQQLVLKWQNYSPKQFERVVFWTAFLIRVAYVFLSYWFYQEMTGEPFEFDSPNDAWTYNEKAVACSDILLNGGGFNDVYLYLGQSLSDVGFVFYLSILYILTNKSIILTRILSALFSALISVYIYKISKRHFGEQIGKLSAISCLFCPYLIFYCGLHLKEIIMTFLCVVYINCADELISENNKWQKWIPVILSGLAIFAFRTVLGAVAFLSFFATLLFSGRKTMSWGKRIVIIIAALIVSFFGASEQITQEVQEVWEAKGTENQQLNMEWRSRRKGGNEFAKYAGAAVFAPLIFTIPFPSMVYTEGQENIRLTNGANYVKNIMSFFTIFTIIMLIISGEWKNNVLLLSFILGYLTVITFSSFAQSGRFHVPVMPFELMLAAYGVCVIKKRQWSFINMWFCFMFVACIAWQWFKLKGRGMI